MEKTNSDKLDNDSGLPSRASSSSSCRDVRMENSSAGTKDAKRGSDPSCETGRSRRVSESWPDFCPEDSIGGINDLYDSEKQLNRVPSVERHRRRGSGRRVRRCESARDGNEPKIRHKVRRSISERGGDDDEKPRRHRHHHHHRQGSKKGKTSRSHSEHSLGSLTDKISIGSNGKSFTRQRSLSESVTMEMGLKDEEDETPKESTRRKIVFAVVVISLAILTASVFLVAITLMLSPAVDAALRKENEETQIMLAPKTSVRPMDGSNRTLLTTVSSAHPDG